MRDHERAREWAEASLQKEDDDKTALLLGRIYTRLGMNTQAEQVFRRCAASDPARSLRFAAHDHNLLNDASSLLIGPTAAPAAPPDAPAPPCPRWAPAAPGAPCPPSTAPRTTPT